MQVIKQNTAAAEKRDFNIEQNFNEIVDLIVNIDQKAVIDTIEKHNRLTLIDKIDIYECLEDEWIYCDKTGKPLRQWDLEQVSKLINTVGKSKAKFILSHQSRNQISPQWIHTDPEALQSLTESDPHGYFIYAASLVLRCFQTFFSNVDKNNSDANFRWQREKVEAYRYIQKQDLSDIIETNELMRRYLTITQSITALDVVQFNNTTLPLCTVHLLQFKKDIINSIKAIIEKEFKAKRLKTDLTYADVVNLTLHYKGHSNFRSQNKLRGMSEIEQVMLTLDTYMPKVNSIKQQRIFHEAEQKIKAYQETRKPIEHTGPLKLTLAPKKEKGLKLSFAAILKQEK